ncbi:MAG: hypothetical protein MUP97_00085 [Acidimicrobiia bacterium]|nr:hypothetical protein [Acidimicrobiia bacterium]
MTLAAGPFAIAATLLLVGGLAKAWRPTDTAHALRGLGVPVPPFAVRLGGLVEAAVGLSALVRGDRVSAILVALSYLAFSGFVIVALARHAPIASCGCFGRLDTPPSTVHVVLDLGALLAAVTVVFEPGVGLSRVLRDQPLAGVPFLLLVITGTFVAFVAMTLLPRVIAATAGADAGSA